MKTTLVRLDALLLGGVGFYGDPFSLKGGWDSDNEIGRTCRRFGEFINANPDRPYSKNKPVFYEVHIYGGENGRKGIFRGVRREKR